MGIITGGLARVRGTKLFARLTANETGDIAQYLVYSTSVSADSEVALILPLPVSSHAEDALDFIPLDGYSTFFEDMDKGFPALIGGPGQGTAGDAGPAGAGLAVQAVGDFIASFVPTVADFDRLDARFRVPAATWDKLPQYSDWGFAVFQLKENPIDRARDKGAARRIHPVAFKFPTDMDESLFFPTLHVHDGRVDEDADFDYTLYFQGDEFQDFADQISPNNADAFMKVDAAKGIVHPEILCGKRSIVGMNPNEDTYALGPG